MNTHKLRDKNINTPEYWDKRHSDFQNTYIAREFDRFFLLGLIPNEELELLDIGCGRAVHFKKLGRKYRKVTWTGLDIAKSAYLWNRENVPGCNFICADINKHPLPVLDYDYIVSMHTFEHLEDPVGLLERCRDHARQKVIINVPFGKFKTVDKEHLFRFDLNGPFTDFSDYLLLREDGTMEKTDNPEEAQEIYFIFDGRAK